MAGFIQGTQGGATTGANYPNVGVTAKPLSVSERTRDDLGRIITRLETLNGRLNSAVDRAFGQPPETPGKATAPTCGSGHAGLISEQTSTLDSQLDRYTNLVNRLEDFV